MATIGEWAKMYGTGNYADTSKRIGTAVEDAIGQNRARVDRIRAQEDRLRKQKLEDYAFQQMKMQEYSGLVIPQDSQYIDLENSFQQAASYIPDAYAALESSGLPQNEISMGKAQLLQEVGSLKESRKLILAQIQTGATALQDGTVSGYNKANTLDFYNGLMTPSSGYSTVMENNQLVLKGKTPVEGKDVSIPLKQYGKRAPMLNIKGPDPLKTINAANKEAYDRGYYVTDSGTKTMTGEYNRSIDDAFDSYIDSLPNQQDAIKASAVDYLTNINTGKAFTSEEVDALADTRNNDEGGFTAPNDEKYANALEYEMERSFKDKATKGFLNSDKERLAQLQRRANINAVQQRANTKSNQGEIVDPNVYQKLFTEIYKPAQGPKNLGAQDVASQNLLPGDVRNVTSGMQSALSGLGFDNLGVYEKVDENNEFEGYSIPKQGKGKKGSVFISKNETDPAMIFKAIMQAHGVSTSQANQIFDDVFLPQIDITEDFSVFKEN
tara:strand:+ start:81 stop:1568 length:1488 start_codon:yes stop_codon:yes gene_type:complete